MLCCMIHLGFEFMEAKNRQRMPMTINNLAIFVPTNGSGISTFKSRKNGANGNLLISVSAMVVVIDNEMVKRLGINDDTRMYNKR